MNTQNTWVGLTGEELGDDPIFRAGARFAEAKLREKNSPVHQDHTDDSAVDRFAAAMKSKMAKARSKGRGGWDNKTDCPTERLQQMLTEHLAKGDPVDIGNFSMMLWNRGEQTTSPALPAVAKGEPVANLLQDVLGCLRAAEIEGLQEALAETTDERLKDLVERRLMYAFYYVRDFDTTPPTCCA